ncbi:tRNA methyl transferase PRC-barrel domain-containing protein [Soonwooa sp.]|uniref:tRNA methyl transferase PRC-barrel domain-containing protein n=1 Tax=Soonwooa sp. TaxID=1938592 RepID=UPI00261DCD45|nr:tRNA methyl transferase PRC-barrel domain-containing protein [Soonwooa sp.]
MNTKGQIVEILASSPLYSQPKPAFQNKEAELSWDANNPKYSLFDGILIGGHDGIEHFKIGQRKGVNQIGGAKESLYVIAIDKTENRILAGAGHNHPGLFAKVFQFSKSNLKWIDEALTTSPLNIKIENTSNKTFLDAKLYQFEDNVFLEFSQPIEKAIFNQSVSIFNNNQIIATIQQA